MVNGQHQTVRVHGLMVSSLLVVAKANSIIEGSQVDMGLITFPLHSFYDQFNVRLPSFCTMLIIVVNNQRDKHRVTAECLALVTIISAHLVGW